MLAFTWIPTSRFVLLSLANLLCVTYGRSSYKENNLGNKELTRKTCGLNKLVVEHVPQNDEARGGRNLEIVISLRNYDGALLLCCKSMAYQICKQWICMAYVSCRQSHVGVLIGRCNDLSA